MSQIQNNAQKRETIEGRPRQVISVTEIRWVAAKFTDSQGNVDVCLGAIFGKDATTGKPNVAVVNPSVLKEFFTIPDTHIREGILAHLSKMMAPPAELPDGTVGSFEIGEL